jgi:hypothetical protein
MSVPRAFVLPVIVADSSQRTSKESNVERDGSDGGMGTAPNSQILRST